MKGRCCLPCSKPLLTADVGCRTQTLKGDVAWETHTAEKMLLDKETLLAKPQKSKHDVGWLLNDRDVGCWLPNPKP